MGNPRTRGGILFAGMMAAAGLLPASGDSIRIMPLGDSITHGYYHGGSTFSGYRKELKSLLDADGPSTDFVGSLSEGGFADNQHEGHDGWHADDPGSTHDILGHAAAWTVDADADIILLHIGTNDILDDGENAAEVSAILDELFSANSNATVVLALIINTSPVRSDISTYNSNLYTLAQTRISAGDDLIVVDMEHGAGLDYASVDMADTYHPSQSGYDKMATNWYPAVTEAINRQLAHRAPSIESFSISNNAALLEVGHLVSGTTVNIEKTASLTATNWNVIGSLNPTNGSVMWSDPDAPTNATGFYRAVLP